MKMTKQVVKNYLRKFAVPSFCAIEIYSKFFSHGQMTKFMWEFGAKHSIVFTNIAGFVKPVKFFGGTIKEMYYLASANGTMATNATNL